MGDSPHDVLAGNAAGVATVATLWGPFSREQLAPARPTAWAGEPRELLEVLESLGIPAVQGENAPPGAGQRRGRD